VIARGTIDGEPAVVAAIESAFQGGSIGEVSGSKIAAALEMALRDCERGKIVRPSCCSKPAASGSRKPTSASR
jgi:Acetyl-CoA carboxylase beta subunit